jgi:glycerophosphoryl diester phosphodiesterase
MATPIAHRGASLYTPENTMPAFTRAHDMGAEHIECDVIVTADNVPVIIHDNDVSRTTNGQGLVNQLPLKTLQSFDAGLWFDKQYQGTRIPTLSELLNWQKKSGFILHLEIKPIYKKSFADDISVILDDITQYGDPNKIKILSFQAKILAELTHRQITLPRVLEVTTCRPQNIQEAQEIGCEQINISHRTLTRSQIDNIQQAGLKVGVYTVNDSNHIKTLSGYAVDEIFTDDPSLFPLIQNAGPHHPAQ